MIELDYAFLADYAAVQEGKLTVVGASFTRIRVSAVPSLLNLSIAGRLRTSVDVHAVSMKLAIEPPENQFRIEAGLELKDGGNSYADKQGILFAAQMALPIPALGFYTVTLDIGGTTGIDRVLKFEAEQA